MRLFGKTLLIQNLQNIFF